MTEGGVLGLVICSALSDPRSFNPLKSVSSDLIKQNSYAYDHGDSSPNSDLWELY